MQGKVPALPHPARRTRVPAVPPHYADQGSGTSPRPSPAESCQGPTLGEGPQSDGTFPAASRTSGAFLRRLWVTFCPPNLPHGQPWAAAALLLSAQPPEGKLLFPSPAASPPSLPRSALPPQPERPGSKKRLFGFCRSVSPSLSGLAKAGAKPSRGSDRRLSAGRNQSGAGESFQPGPLPKRPALSAAEEAAGLPTCRRTSTSSSTASAMATGWTTTRGGGRRRAGRRTSGPARPRR